MFDFACSGLAADQQPPPKVLPINNEINKIANDSSKPDARGPESGPVDKILGDWAKYHSVRISIGAVAWGLGMAALLLAY